MVKKEYHTKLAGVTKRNDCDERIQSLLKDISDYCYEGMPLTVEHESDNPYDKNAIKVFCEGDHIGYIKRELAEELAPLVDKERVEVELCEITGGEGGKSFGCNILVRILSGKTPDSTTRNEHQVYGAEYFRALSDEDFSLWVNQFSERLNKSSPVADKGVLDKIEDQLSIINAEMDRREAELKAKISNIDNSASTAIKILDAEYLESMPDKEFFKWVNEFLEWGKSLPRTVDAQTFAYAQSQLRIINAELRRRTQNFRSGKFSARPIGGNFAAKETLFDRLIPVDSFREKALPFVAGIVSFAVTMSTLIFLFA